jgi:hypothetical protein
MVISAEKTDILRYYSESGLGSKLFYVLQPEARGLCDAVFRALPYVRAEHSADELVLIGLPDTIWFPPDNYAHVPRDSVHLITFPVADPEHFDAVICGGTGEVKEVQVKQPGARSRRIWGAITAPAHLFVALHRLWLQRDCADEYLGSLFNAWIAGGAPITADSAGTDYLDVGTLDGYHRALARMRSVEKARHEAA